MALQRLSKFVNYKFSALFLILLTGCNDQISSNDDTSPAYTLYRNSPIDPTMRIHFASFDAHEKGFGDAKYDYNRGNCQLVADLLRSNVLRETDGASTVRYWCELGPYREKL